MANEEQEDELLALKSIFSEEEFLKLNSAKQRNLFRSFSDTAEQDKDVDENLTSASSAADVPLTSGDFSAHVQFSDTFYIEDFQGDKGTASIKFLPPIVLGFELPLSYPASSAPKIHLSCKWLIPSQLSQLCNQLDSLWKENEGQSILYIWFDFLQQDSMRFLGIENSLKISSKSEDSPGERDDRVIQDIASNNILFNFLVDYDKNQQKLEFDRASWACAVCFTDRPGSESFRFHGCGHIYCKECMRRHFTVRIESGDVKQLTCPEEKCETQGHPSQLKDLLTADLYDRYERLLLQTTLDSMLDITYCPRSFCQTAVLLDPDSTMASCAACQFVFCRNCKMSYHGIHPCNIRTAELKKKLEDASEEDMEAYKERYGKQFVDALIKETASYEWMNKNCEPCPVCSVNITKADGCNKMTCIKCKAFFCWLCKSVLPRGNPYAHYRDNPNCHLFPGENDMDIIFEDIDLQLMGLD